MCIRDSLNTEWMVCGESVASGKTWVAVHLPEPVGLAVSWSTTRATSPTDDASSSPINIPTSATITVRVSYDNGAVKDMSVDPRVQYTVVDSRCARADGNAVSILAGTACEHVSVTVDIPAFAQYGDFVANTTLALTYIDRFVVDFSGYPELSLIHI